MAAGWGAVGMSPPSTRASAPRQACTWLQTGQVPRFPTAILVTGLMVLAALNLFTGLILDTVVRGRREMRRLAYLAIPAPRN